MTSDKKARLVLEDGGEIPCMFNPKEISISQSASWGTPKKKSTKGTKSADGTSDHASETEEASEPAPVDGQNVYRGLALATTKLELLFDSSIDGKPVNRHTEKLAVLLKPNASLQTHVPEGANGRPPWVQLRWGKETYFKGIVTSLAVKFTYFSDEGLPLRAFVTLGLQQLDADQKVFGRQNPTSGTPYPHRVHRVVAGDRLETVAQRYYKNPGAWRRIAAANGITDPLSLQPGTLLRVPDAREQAR